MPIRKAPSICMHAIRTIFKERIDRHRLFDNQLIMCYILRSCRSRVYRISIMILQSIMRSSHTPTRTPWKYSNSVLLFYLHYSAAYVRPEFNIPGLFLQTASGILCEKIIILLRNSKKIKKVNLLTAGIKVVQSPSRTAV